MELVTLPNSDLKVSQVCVGTWQFNGGQTSADKTWQAQPEELSKKITDKAIECGINFFDTAEGYLNSEEVLGRILEGRRKNVVIASKFGAKKPGTYGPEDIEAALTQSLQSLKTDYIDLYQVHWPMFMKDTQSCVDELKRQQALGRIRYYGISNFGPKNLKEFIDAGGEPVTNQFSYSLLWRPAEYEVIPYCKENNVGVLTYSSLQQGLLSGKYLKLEDVPEGRRRTRLFNSSSIVKVKEVCDNAGVPMPSAALSWCLQDPIKCVIVGASSPEQIESNAKLAKLQQDVRQQLSGATEELRNTFGNSPDLWAKESRIA